MTNCILAVSLLLTPPPIQAPKETHTWLVDSSNVSSVEISPMTFGWSFPPMESLPSPSVETPTPASSDSLPSPEASMEPTPSSSTPPISPFDMGMNRLTELGANPYQLRVFGCLAWFESRNDPLAWSPTNDRGLWQIHFPLHAWRFDGRDWRDPIANAEVAWDIYRESGWRAWTTARLCGV